MARFSIQSCHSPAPWLNLDLLPAAFTFQMEDCGIGNTMEHDYDDDALDSPHPIPAIYQYIIQLFNDSRKSENSSLNDSPGFVEYFW